MLNNMRSVEFNNARVNLYELTLLKDAYNNRICNNSYKNVYDKYSRSMLDSLQNLKSLGFVETTIFGTYFLTNKGYEWIESYVSTKQTS